MRVLLVDDEEPGRINLRYALARHPQWQVAGECASASAARELLARQEVDLVFLDVQMPKESGIDLARSLSAMAEPPLIVFVTAYNVYAIEAFEVHAMDYLLKPFDDARLAQTLERAAAMLAQRQQAGFAPALRAYVAAQTGYWQQVSVRSIGRIECIRLEDVQWLEADGNYVKLHLEKRCVLYRMPLSRLEEHLDPVRFVRVHRRAIVAAVQFSSMSVVGDGSYLLALRCGDTVAVSERHVEAARARLAAG
ncbi:LytR/AlgR family response regulator transcription factor [Duganella violaceipulchra]|uniref:LytTR family DNA-binding domain-containing protein n=1 Tax=Duganella violaceipulchra TaxID=2849652 RepID=A0AA41L5I7_9BURK|nr:LytTR family DNA-binding domain-containing protein [Duganella violaceicalia]MBV6322272.1 LytTR family DNA-binding domain-containing protein [Duganella violaceicalia]MCP2011419.1 two-component system LytT family response regulator [Duganella violaceicalia]